MKKIKYLILVCIMFFTFQNVEAKEINHFTTKIDEDVEINNIYNSSVAAAGESVSFDGTIHGIAFGAGNNVTLDGETDYGVFAGNYININGTVSNDSLIAGNIINTNDTALFQRDVIIAASDIELAGTFNRNISVYGNKVTIKNATIKGNLKLYSTTINIQKDTVVEGTLYYPEDSSYKASKDAKINKVEKTPAIQTEDEENYFSTVSSKIFNFLGFALIYAALSLFFPRIFTNINEKYAEFTFGEAIEVFTKGLVIIILVPVIAILLCCTMIGVPLGIILLIIYGLAIYLSSIFTAYLIGYKIWQKIFDKDAHILLFGIIGLFVLLILQLIPGIRTLATILTILVGLGLIFDSIKKIK